MQIVPITVSWINLENKKFQSQFATDCLWIANNSNKQAYSQLQASVVRRVFELCCSVISLFLPETNKVKHISLPYSLLENKATEVSNALIKIYLCSPCSCSRPTGNCCLVFLDIKEGNGTMLEFCKIQHFPPALLNQNCTIC